MLCSCNNHSKWKRSIQTLLSWTDSRSDIQTLLSWTDSRSYQILYDSDQASLVSFSNRSKLAFLVVTETDQVFGIYTSLCLKDFVTLIDDSLNQKSNTFFFVLRNPESPVLVPQRWMMKNPSESVFGTKFHLVDNSPLLKLQDKTRITRRPRILLQQFSENEWIPRDQERCIDLRSPVLTPLEDWDTIISNGDFSQIQEFFEGLSIGTIFSGISQSVMYLSKRFLIIQFF